MSGQLGLCRDWAGRPLLALRLVMTAPRLALMTPVVCVLCVCVRARVSTNGRGEGAGEMNVGERQMERDRDGRLARVILGVVPNFA